MVETTAYLVSRTAASICCPPPHPEQGSFKNKPVKKPFVTDPGTACAAAQGMDMVLPTMWSVTCQLYKTSQGICCIWCCKDMMAYATGSSQEELLHQAYQMCCLRLPDTGSCSRLKGSSLGLNPGQHISVWTLNSALVLLPGFCVFFLHCSQQIAKLRRSFEHYEHLYATEHGAQTNSACSKGVVLVV